MESDEKRIRIMWKVEVTWGREMGQKKSVKRGIWKRQMEWVDREWREQMLDL